MGFLHLAQHLGLADHLALGTQAANLILDLSDTGWHAGQHPIELPLSTINALNVQQARDKFAAVHR